MSRLKETCKKRNAVERTNKAKIRPAGRTESEKTESCRENLRNEIQMKRP